MSGKEERQAQLRRGIYRRALVASVYKLSPRHQVRNPVMFVVEVCSLLLTLVLALRLAAAAGEEAPGFIAAITSFLWLTVLFANFAEALAEGRGRAQAEALRRARSETRAKRLEAPARDARYEVVSSTDLRAGDVALLEAGDAIPADGDVVEGVAAIDEAALLPSRSSWRFLYV